MILITSESTFDSVVILPSPCKPCKPVVKILGRLLMESARESAGRVDGEIDGDRDSCVEGDGLLTPGSNLEGGRH